MSGPAPTRSGRRAARGLLSVVIPCHNEQDVIETTHGRLVEVLPTTGMDFEIIYVDDGSRDATLERLERIAAREGRVTVIELSRNFGQQAAMSAGLAAARGDAIRLGRPRGAGRSAPCRKRVYCPSFTRS